MISLKERLASLSQIPRKKIPLSCLLHLYKTGSEADMYCNHFEGFILFIKALGQIEIEYPSITREQIDFYFKNQRFLGSYEVNRLAMILNTEPEIIFFALVNFRELGEHHDRFL